MKTLASKDITKVKAEDVKIGMVTVEGMIIAVNRQAGKKKDTMFFEHAAQGCVTFAQVGDDVQVYAQMERQTLDAIMATFDK